jgi:hypothetical protein
VIAREPQVPPASPETGLKKHSMLRWATWVGDSPVPLSCHPMTACPFLSVPQQKKLISVRASADCGAKKCL